MNEIDLTLFGERMKQVLADTRAIKYDMSGLRAQVSALEVALVGWRHGSTPSRCGLST